MNTQIITPQQPPFSRTIALKNLSIPNYVQNLFAKIDVESLEEIKDHTIAISPTQRQKIEAILIERFAHKLTEVGNECSFTDEEVILEELDLALNVEGRITARNSIHTYDEPPCDVVFISWVAECEDGEVEIKGLE